MRSFRYGLGFLILGIALIALLVSHDAGSIGGMDLDDFAGLALMLALLVVLGGALFGSRAGFGHAARGALIWIGLFLLLIGGYAYRTELTGVAGRIVGALAPGSELAQRLSATGETVTVFRSGRGHFYPAGTVNGTPVTFLFDTGASTVVLTAEDARRLGIDVERLSFSVPVSTANGRTTAAPVRLDEIEISGIRVDRVTAMVARPGQLRENLLGLSFLNRLSEWSVRDDRLILTQ